MTDSLTGLSDASLRGLAAGLRSKRISSPFTPLQVARVIAGDAGKAVAGELAKLETIGFSADQIAIMLELLIKDRQSNRAAATPVELVTSGPEAPGITNRDTSVVVRELFAHAQKSVLVVGYAVYQGQQVFETLALRMETIPDLDVRFFLNIARPDHDTTPPEILVSRFIHQFKTKQWPTKCRLPQIYYDPRSIADIQPVRSSLHAKCIVVDGEQVFVSSANFTQAAQERNIEVGLIIQGNWLASRLTEHFQQLHRHGLASRAL